MKLREVMTTNVQSCPPGWSLGEAALTMWRADCGIVPVVNEERKVLGVITDRDICMGLATTGKPPYERTVSEIMSGTVHTVPADADVSDALREMREHRVRRLPVTDADGALAGIISLNDLIEHVETPTGRGELRGYAPELLHTLKAICAHPAPALAATGASRAEAIVATV